MGKGRYFLLLFLTLFLVFGCLQQQTPTEQIVQQEGQEEVFVSVKVYNKETLLVDKEIPLEKGINALKAMETVVDVSVKEFEFGVFVDSIAGVKADSEHYWALSINGNFAEKGIDQYIIEEDMQIEWRLEEISAFPAE